jgi:hypothetical protein
MKKSYKELFKAEKQKNKQLRKQLIDKDKLVDEYSNLYLISKDNLKYARALIKSTNTDEIDKV